jgi:hypothetical protein
MAARCVIHSTLAAKQNPAGMFQHTAAAELIRRQQAQQLTTASVTLPGVLMISGAIQGRVPRSVATPVTYVCCFCLDRPKSATLQMGVLSWIDARDKQAGQNNAT